MQKSAAEFSLIPLAEIKLSTAPLQIIRRGHYDSKALADLADDVIAHGVMEPVLVRRLHPAQGPLKFEMVAGERRFLAAKAVKHAALPAMVLDITEAMAEEMQISENIHRADLHVLEEAEGYQRLCQIHKCPAKDLVARVGRNEAHIYARLKLLALCPQVKDIVYAGRINHSIALEIARIPDPAMQQKAAKGCATGRDTGGYYDGPLTIDDAREYIQTEFMQRIEGDRAIAEAKKAGKKVITGDQAEAMLDHDRFKNHVVLSDDFWLDKGNKKKLYRDVLGTPPETVIVQLDDGKVVEAVPHEVARKIFTDKKIKLPFELQPRTTGRISADMPAADKAKIQREQRKKRLAIDIRLATFKAVRAKYPAKLGKPELLELIELVGNVTGKPPETIAPIPKSPDKLTEKGLVGITLDLILGGRLDDDYRWEDPHKRCLAAAKRYGVDAGKISKQLTAEFQAKEAERAKAGKVKK